MLVTAKENHSRQNNLEFTWEGVVISHELGVAMCVNKGVSPGGRVLKFCFMATQNYVNMGRGHAALRSQLNSANLT